jgi:hypothetical protein
MIKLDLSLQNIPKWAMLVSNQRPLPCEGSEVGCWSLLSSASSNISVLTLFPVLQEVYSGCCTVAANLVLRNSELDVSTTAKTFPNSM